MIVNISDAKKNLPIADLVIHKSKGRRKLGLLKGKVNIPNSFTEESADINELFYGD